MSSLVRLPGLLVATLVLGTPALAGPFDLIHTDQVDVTLCENGCGITLSGCDFAVLVNVGAAPITANEMRAARFTAVSSETTIALYPFLNQYTSVLPDLDPGHARGGVCESNAFLQTFLLPGEVFENTQGYQFLSFNISRLGTGTFEGPVTFYVTMDMAGYRATFQIDAMVHLGPHDIALLHGARVHSVPGPPPPITAQLDIRPGECPNVFNPKSQGRVAMALVGSPTLNVRDIELASVRLNGFMPLRTAFLDVARAFSTIPCECADGVDGVEDLSLRFASEDVAAAIGPTAPGSVTTLTVTGLLTNGAPFEASDCLHIVGPPPRDSIPPDSVVARMFVRRGASRGAAQIEYTLAADADVDLDVYDVTGRHLESLVQTRQQSGEHQVEWRAENMQQGVYFFRLTAAGQMQMRRFVLLR